MLVTQEEGLRHFWYAVIRASELSTGPKSFTLLGEKIVLWLDEAGKPAAARDRCCHRSAKLSKGWVENGAIICPYHGWGFASSGACVRIPQLEGKAVPKAYCVPAYRCQEKYGQVWVCLGEPVCDIPEFSEASDPSYRFIPFFYETWNTSSHRVIENELDMAHFAYVHRKTIGNPAVPLPLTYELKELGPTSLHLRSELSVCAPGQQQKNTRSNSHVTTRTMDVTWFAPFMVRLQLSYPSGLRHIIINQQAPIDDTHTQVVQFSFRNDKESDATVKEILEFEALVLNEDRVILEAVDPFVSLGKTEEAHIATDRAGMLFRRKLARLLADKREESVLEAELG